MSSIQTEVVSPVDLDYTDKIPPVGEDHIDYAIKHNNVAVRRTMATGENIKIKTVKEQGACLFLEVTRPIDPTKPPSTDPVVPSEWESRPRTHRRLTVGQILAGKVPDGLTVTKLDKTSVVNAIKDAGIGITEADVDVKIVGLVATVENIADGSYIWWGAGDVKLNLTTPVVLL